LSKYQNDAGEPGINSLVKLAEYFGVSTDYMLGITDIACGNADDMAISKRLGLNSKSINELSRFIDKEDGNSTFLNALSKTDFWNIIYNIELAYVKYMQAMIEEHLAFRDKPEQRLLYTIDHADYKPVKNIGQLGFTLSLSAEHYYDFCLQEAGTNLKWLMKELADNRLDKLDFSDPKTQTKQKKLRKTRREKEEERDNG
jgi:transcriptional regulator with XRE-family HTH domain